MDLPLPRVTCLGGGEKTFCSCSDGERALEAARADVVLWGTTLCMLKASPLPPLSQPSHLMAVRCYQYF